MDCSPAWHRGLAGAEHDSGDSRWEFGERPASVRSARASHSRSWVRSRNGRGEDRNVRRQNSRAWPRVCSATTEFGPCGWQESQGNRDVCCGEPSQLCGRQCRTDGSIRPECSRRQSLKLQDRKSTRLNSSHVAISYAVFCLKKKRRWSAGCCMLRVKSAILKK